MGERERELLPVYQGRRKTHSLDSYFTRHNASNRRWSSIMFGMTGNIANAGATNLNYIDIAASLGVNYLATDYACKQSQFRVGKPDASGQVKLHMDYRLWAGVLGAAAGHFWSNSYGWQGGVARAAQDVAVGSLNSLVATETCRNAAAKMDGGGQTPPPPQVTTNPDGTVGYDHAHASANYAYGW